MTSDTDIQYMRAALSLARRGLGRVAPNPSVGCVIVKSGRMIGRGRTADTGRPHAEAKALAQAGHEAKGGVAYVTLEPCAVPGRESSCAAALVRAGVSRVVIACHDLNPQVFGKGIEILKNAGIEVTLGVLEEKARETHRGFFLRMTENRPMVTLKMAISCNGMIALADRRRVQITGPLALRHAHLERSQHDAILVGIGTVLNDNPLLTTRLEDVNHKSIRIILDSKLEIPVDSRLVRSAGEAPIWVFHETGAPGKIRDLEKAGVRLLSAGRAPADILKKLAEEGINRLLVEGGEFILKAFVEAGFGDRFLLYRAPNLTLPEGISLNFPAIREKLGLVLTGTRGLGEDLLEIYTRQA